MHVAASGVLEGVLHGHAGRHMGVHGLAARRMAGPAGARTLQQAEQQQQQAQTAAEPSRPLPLPPPSIRILTVVGERHSGTNFMDGLLRSNLEKDAYEFEVRRAGGARGLLCRVIPTCACVRACVRACTACVRACPHQHARDAACVAPCPFPPPARPTSRTSSARTRGPRSTATSCPRCPTRPCSQRAGRPVGGVVETAGAATAAAEEEAAGEVSLLQPSAATQGFTATLQNMSCTLVLGSGAA
jgi:hypothetical protein